VAPTSLREAPIFELDARDAGHPGTAALRRHLIERASPSPGRPEEGLFRLAVDRVFTLAGHGTVVTGTVFAGRVRTGDTIVVMPAGTPPRARAIPAQSRTAGSPPPRARRAPNSDPVSRSP